MVGEFLKTLQRIFCRLPGGPISLGRVLERYNIFLYRGPDSVHILGEGYTFFEQVKRKEIQYPRPGSGIFDQCDQ